MPAYKAANKNELKHLLLTDATLRSMPDLIETLPDSDAYFRCLEQVLKVCEKRNGGCDLCDRTRKCNDLWDIICDLSDEGRLGWVAYKGGYLHTDEKARRIIPQLMEVARASSQIIRDAVRAEKPYMVKIKELVVEDADGHYRLRQRRLL